MYIVYRIKSISKLNNACIKTHAQDSVCCVVYIRRKKIKKGGRRISKLFLLFFHTVWSYFNKLHEKKKRFFEHSSRSTSSGCVVLHCFWMNEKKTEDRGCRIQIYKCILARFQTTTKQNRTLITSDFINYCI